MVYDFILYLQSSSLTTIPHKKKYFFILCLQNSSLTTIVNTTHTQNIFEVKLYKTVVIILKITALQHLTSPSSGTECNENVQDVGVLRPNINNYYDKHVTCYATNLFHSATLLYQCHLFSHCLK